MANAFRTSNARALVECDSLVDAIDTGGAGTIKIYSGSAPTNVEDVATGTLIGTLTYSATAFGGAADANPGATATAAAVTSGTAVASATAGYFRILNGSGTAIAQGTCGTSGCDMNWNSVVISSGATLSLTSQTVTVPEV